MYFFLKTGVHIDDVDAVLAQGVDPQFVSECVGKMYADMIFKFGYVHCDPHPGNVLVQKGWVLESS